MSCNVELIERTGDVDHGYSSPVMDSTALESSSEQHEFSLPPADTGKDAWLFLATCFLVEAVVWGFPFSYGIFQDYYGTHEPFVGKSSIAVVGTTALGIMYLDALFINMVHQRWPNLRKPTCGLGLLLVVVALIASSFATKVWHLILTQGVMYALGGSMLYYPMLLFLDEWFVRKKGIAFGIMWAGTGAGGVGVPFLLSWALSRFLLSTVLRASAVLMAVFLTPPLLIFVKPRLPVTISSTDSSRRRFNFRFAFSPVFLALQAGNTIQGLGYFIPGIYLPSYAQELGMNKASTTATVSLLNVTGVLGCIVVGLLIDRVHVTTVLWILAVGSLLSVFCLWGFASNAQTLLCFSALYGFFAAPFTTTYTGVVREVRSNDNSAETGLIMGLLAVGRGIGSVVAGPISERLLSFKASDRGVAGYEGHYENLILFTGICVALGGVSFGAKKLGLI